MPPRRTEVPLDMLGRDEAEKGHELAWGVEAGEIAQLGDQRDRRQQVDAAQGLQGVDDRHQAPAPHLLGDLVLETLEASGGLVDGSQVLLQRDPLRRCCRGT